MTRRSDDLDRADADAAQARTRLTEALVATGGETVPRSDASTG